MKNRGQVLLIGFMCFLIAASICVQYRSISTYTSETGNTAVQSTEENKLRDKVLEKQEEYDNLYVKAQEAQIQLEELRKASAENSDEAQALEEQLTELNRLLGYTDVTGKGIIITIRDADSDGSTYTSDSLVHDLDLVEVVNELFNAGAEAVSINGQRIISTTAITCNGNVVRINNEKISAPFVIKAIGSPEGLYESIFRPGGYLELMEDDKIRITYELVEENLVVPKYTGTRQYDYLESVE